MSDTPLLSVSNLVVGFESGGKVLRAVDGVSFDVRKGRTLGIVGESGCGKSVTAFSIMRLLPQPHGRILDGSIFFEGGDLVRATEPELHQIRGGRIGMVFQEPLSALNPVQTIGKQLSEVILLHKQVSKRQALSEAVTLLGKVGIPSPEVRVSEYPHQLSGGMRQRVVIAMALSCNPSLLIADEPTTALDVTIQAQILDLMLSLQRELGMAIVLITHDLGVIAQVCDDVVVMYAGQVAEQGTVEDIFRKPTHPYTRGLLASVPRLTTLRKSRLPTIEGAVPMLNEMPPGCRYQNRCPYAEARCGVARPPLETMTQTHAVSCVRWNELPPFEPYAKPKA
ncbi:MAG TPA: ABC transporter ATP-binding protein [Opitutaceae bacterium]|nr:ABC transporter ATP-binding protein [Opitutaceae bacterium]